jgi:formylglycine-generating enzyme required for sulfatase activity
MLLRSNRVAAAALASALAAFCGGCDFSVFPAAIGEDAAGGEDATSSAASPCVGDDASTSDDGRDASPAPSAGDGGTPPSCAPGGPGMTNCGAGSESCCVSLEVEGGIFDRTYGGGDGGDDAATEGTPAVVTGFRLDEYLVTVGRFRQFVDAWNGGAGYLPPDGSGKHAYLASGRGLANGDPPGSFETGWDAVDWNAQVSPTDCSLACGLGTWTPAPAGQENLPITCVNWYEAYAFCIWDGAFLPSDAELEYAAAGGSEQRPYPWGASSAVSSRLAIVQFDDLDAGPDGSFSAAAYASALEGSGVPGIAPVGTALAGAGRWGQLDLAGEVLEWELDWFEPFFEPCTDCAGLTYIDGPATYQTESGQWALLLGGVTARALRGSSVASPLVPVASETGSDPTSRSALDGFRCARPP